jgi:hypothetical protein
MRSSTRCSRAGHRPDRRKKASGFLWQNLAGVRHWDMRAERIDIACAPVMPGQVCWPGIARVTEGEARL